MDISLMMDDDPAATPELELSIEVCPPEPPPSSDAAPTGQHPAGIVGQADGPLHEGARHPFGQIDAQSDQRQSDQRQSDKRQYASARELASRVQQARVRLHKMNDRLEACRESLRSAPRSDSQLTEQVQRTLREARALLEETAAEADHSSHQRVVEAYLELQPIIKNRARPAFAPRASARKQLPNRSWFASIFHR